MKNNLLLVAGLTLSLSAFAQTSSQSTIAIEPMSATPHVRVNVVSRSVSAVNYKHRGGATKLDFAGTAYAWRPGPGQSGKQKGLLKSKLNSLILRSPPRLAVST